MTKIIHINTSGVMKYVVHLALQDSDYELITISFLENLEEKAIDSNLVILGRDLDVRNDGWKIAKKLARKKVKVIVIAGSPPPKRYSKIKRIDDEKLFFKEINLKEIVDSMLIPK